MIQYRHIFTDGLRLSGPIVLVTARCCLMIVLKYSLYTNNIQSSLNDYIMLIKLI